MPLSAVTCRGQPSVRAGSTTASAGRRNWLSVLTLMWLAVSVSTAACETSLPVPAVVGTQTSGSTGPGHVVEAEVSGRLAAVREQDGDDLGQVHVAAAAQAQDRSRGEVRAAARPPARPPPRSARLAVVEDLARECPPPRAAQRPALDEARRYAAGGR